MKLKARIVGAAALTLPFLVGCGTAPVPVLGPDPGPRSVHDLLRAEFGGQIRAWPKTREEALALCEGGDVFVVVSRNPLVRCPFPAPVQEVLATSVRQGKGLLLLGATTRLAFDLGFEPTEPDRIGVYRWGMSDETLLGNYEFGAIVKDAAARPLVDRLVAEDDAQKPGLGEEYRFGGGDLVQVQCCHWEQHDPEKGVVLGRLVRTRDGERKELDAVVLTRWSPDQGRVLAIGSMPEPWRADARIGGNARLLLGNAVRALKSELGKDRVILLVDGLDPAVGAGPTFAVHPMERDLPGVPTLAAWGLDVPLDAGGQGRLARKREGVLADWVLPSWRAGAGVVQIAPADDELGYPVPWSRDDKLTRPGAWFGGEHWPEWAPRGLGTLVAEIHAKGLLADLRIDPVPARGGSRVEVLTATRFLGRELCDVRRSGARAFDSFFVRAFCSDVDGIALDLVRTFQPGALGFCGELRSVPLAGFAQVQDARVGRLRGLTASGVSEAWRPGFAADEVLAGVVDAHATPSTELVQKKPALGSYLDWIVTQATDFARPRLGRGARLLFEGCDPNRDPATFRAVLGVGLDPLRTATAGRLVATGTGGFRALERELAGPTQPGFGPECELPHDTPFLQNNRVRLCGSGGPLWLDPSGTGRFRTGTGPVELSPALLTTRVRGVKPSTEPAPDLVLDLVHGAPRGPGGYGEAVLVHGDERGKSAVPAQLAVADLPRWPRKVQVTCTLDAAEYELELVLRGVQGRGIVEVRREDEVVHLVRYATGEGSVRTAIPCPVGRGGERTFGLEVLCGGVVAIDGWRIVRKGEFTAETRVATPAGWRAELLEQTAAGFLVEQKRIATIGDLPGVVVQIDYERVDRGLEVRRVLAVPAYQTLARLSPRDKPGLLREPFVLTSKDPKLPPLAIVPIEMPRYHRFAFEPDGTLSLIGYPRSHERVRFGVVALVDHTQDQVAQLATVLQEVCEPRTLELTPDGTCELASDLPFRWPRVVKIHNASQSPFLVEEAGAFVLRGGQKEPTGGDLLLCWQDPGKLVRIRAGAALARSPRPGPGANGIVVVATNSDDQALVRVLQGAGALVRPTVVFGAAFDEVSVDGKLWAWGTGTTVHLPSAPAVHDVAIKTTGRAPYPHLGATRAPVLSCTWDDAEQTLEMLIGATADGASSWPAWITGPVPLAIVGAERIPEEELTYARETDAQAALSGGVLVRLAPGLVRIRYAPTALTKPLTTNILGQ